jgi:hypothetical protein
MKPPGAYIGRRVRKKFTAGVFEGTVTATRQVRGEGDLWRVRYADGDEEELDFLQLRALMAASARVAGMGKGGKGHGQKGGAQAGAAGPVAAAALRAEGAGAADGAQAAQGAARRALLQ